MTVEWGLMACIMSGFLYATQCVVARSALTPRTLSLQKRLVSGGLLAVSMAVMTLVWALWKCDFSVSYVAAHTHTHQPWYYRVTALWGGHEGSLLLWIWLLSVWMFAMSRFSRALPDMLWVRAQTSLSLVYLGLLAFILGTSNPFLRLLPWPPHEGHELMPLLQDPGLISHPPILYLGYVGCSVAFALTMAALWEGKLTAAWASWVRPWVIASWSFLTLGIVLGSWWAYRELGWGGYWYWDPVENASLMPWLAATALVHALSVTSKRGQGAFWVALLAILAFFLSMLGTFIVRSGIVVSVHSFAIDPSRGLWLFVYLSVLLLSSFVVLGRYGAQLSDKIRLRLPSRGAWILANNVLMLTAIATVLLGTLYPLAAQWIWGERLSVGAPFFVQWMTPLTALFALLLGVTLMSEWREQWPQGIQRRLGMHLGVSVLLSIVMVWMIGAISLALFFGLFLVFWVLLATIRSKMSPGARLAHLGFAFLLFGVTLSSVLVTQDTLVLHEGQKQVVHQLPIHLTGVQSIRGPNYEGVEASIVTDRNVLAPQIRFYPASQTSLSKVAIDHRWWGDLYVALGQQVKQNAWQLSVYRKPGVYYLWLGGIMMMFGGLVSVWRSRR